MNKMDDENMDNIDEDEMLEDESNSEMDDDDDDEPKGPAKTYLPGEPLEEGEELVCDESAYVLYHQAQTEAVLPRQELGITQAILSSKTDSFGLQKSTKEGFLNYKNFQAIHTGAPCLSFDVIPDNLGENREKYPLTCFIAAGTQSQRGKSNHVIVMKMSNLNKNSKASTKNEDSESESESSESEDEDEKPELETAVINHSSGAVNRIRVTKLNDRHIAATWSDKGKVHVWDLSRPVAALNDPTVMTSYVKNEESAPALYTFTGHQVEGFALDWSTTSPGKLLTGDCNKNIHLWRPGEGGWQVDQRPFAAHTSSVEDIQWSPNEDNVFASCSVDRSIRIWDSRAAPTKACMLTTEGAHERDVNVIHWNRNEPFLLSGGDDGVLKIWDLRQFQHGKAAALFKHHTAPITSVEWHPTDSSVFAAAGSDDQVSLWDLGVERDLESPAPSQGEPEVPAQLLFIHQGQTDIKEIHWHRQLPGVVLSTAHSGFNVFRTISV